MTNRSRGNMLVLSGVLVAVNAIGLLVASSFGSLYFVHNRLQSTADEIALEGARKLNEQDQLGQMNNMIARSRQLVFDAGKSSDDANEHLAHLSELAEQLHQEARDGAILMETERVKLRTVSKAEAQSAMINRFNQIRTGHGLALPWLRVSIPVTPIITFGKVDKVQSNVQEIIGLDELTTEDHNKQYIQTDGSKLYKEGIDAKLPGSSHDGDLNFHLSSLPAPVLESVSPARAVLANKFKTSAADQLSSAVQVELKVGVDTGLGASAHSDLTTIGTAEATGGQKMM